MTDLVEERLARVGRVTVIDVHSYPSQRLPYELGGVQRPSVCLGTDPYHTPQWLLSRARETFSACGDVAENTPFAGCYVPLRHFEKDRRVSALMVEIRRDI
jgi:N-formylglutamate amidohydrolase